MLKASSYQGQGNFKKVIEVSLNALRLDPKSQLAFLMLGDDYLRMKQFAEAKNILKQSLKNYPNDFQFNYLLACTLIENGDALEEAIPFLRVYLRNSLKEKGKFPFWMKLLAKLFGKKMDWDKYWEKLDNYESSRYKWALDIVTKYDKKDS